MVSDRNGRVRQIVRIDADAVTADQSGAEVEEVPFRFGGRQHVVHRNAHLVEDGGNLVDEGDIDVALRVLDDLGSFGGADVGGDEHAALGHLAVNFR